MTPDARAARTRAVSYGAARQLALTIVDGRSPGIQAYDLGIVLRGGEPRGSALPPTTGGAASRDGASNARTSRNGRRSTYDEVSRPCMYSVGIIDWLITNRRLAARQPDGQIISIWWTALEAISADLSHEIVTLDRTDGYHGKLHSPEIAPLAVAAIGSCYGPSALVDDPCPVGFVNRCEEATYRDPSTGSRPLISLINRESAPPKMTYDRRRIVSPGSTSGAPTVQCRRAGSSCSPSGDGAIDSLYSRRSTNSSAVKDVDSECFRQCD